MKNRNVPGEWRLYVIVDRAAVGARSLQEVTTAAIRGGADVIQLREKSASVDSLTRDAAQLLPLTRTAGIPLILNDSVDAVQASGADGVHLGQDDLPLEEARGVLGPHRLIGKSTHSPEQALAAVAEGADYLGFGPIFPTSTKPDYGSVGLELIPTVIAAVRIPVVCIGGIEPGNLTQVLEAGASCVAVVRAVCRADDPEAATRHLKYLLIQYGRVNTSAPL